LVGRIGYQLGPPSAALHVVATGAIYGSLRNDGGDTMSARVVAGMMLLWSMLAILWLKASTAWFFALF
jgi:hypothetical protein